MPKEAATLEQASLTKRGLLEYLEAQRGPVTAKVASIDLDCRASTVTEMLERCVAQNLVDRTTQQRPREYKLSDEGRRRLESFHFKEGDRATESTAEPDAPESLSDYVTRLIDDAIESALQKRKQQNNSPDGGRTERRNRVNLLLERAERLAADEHPEEMCVAHDPQERETVTAISGPCVRELLGVERGLSKLPRRELEKLRDSLRSQVGDEGVCRKISSLVEAEVELSEQSDGWWPHAETKNKLETEIASLKSELGLLEEGAAEEVDQAEVEQDEEG